MANESLIHDALHLSDDDFGSKYGRDRTAKETVARSANETAGYKAAEEEAKKDKAKTRAIENEDFKDKRTPKSDLIRQAELDKMKEILKMPKGPSGGGGGGGSGDLEKGMMGGRFKPVAKAKGGKVSSASKRADGCAVKGKTRGRMV